VKYLIDENLSPTLVQRLAKKGIDAAHVAHRGLSGMTDPKVWAYALDEERVVVTLNEEDFVALAAASSVHAGLMVVREPGLSREEQWKLLEPIIDRLEESGEDLINKVCEVSPSGRFAIRRLPKD
jgi:predicted nuclease of predicted toxin-antitoxin system